MKEVLTEARGVQFSDDEEEALAADDDENEDDGDADEPPKCCGDFPEWMEGTDLSEYSSDEQDTITNHVSNHKVCIFVDITHIRFFKKKHSPRFKTQKLESLLHEISANNNPSWANKDNSPRNPPVLLTQHSRLQSTPTVPLGGLSPTAIHLILPFL